MRGVRSGEVVGVGAGGASDRCKASWDHGLSCSEETVGCGEYDDKGVVRGRAGCDVGEHEQVEHVSRHEHWIKLNNGSVIFWRGEHDLTGMRFRFIGFDDMAEISENSFKFWVKRQDHSIRQGRWAGATVPPPRPPKQDGEVEVKPHWIKRLFHPDSEERISNLDYFKAATADNCYLPPEYEERLRKEYPEGWVKRYLDGIWEAEEKDEPNAGEE